MAERVSLSLAFLPTPTVAHLRNHDEPVANYLQRRQDFADGKTKGMPGASLGVAVRMELDSIDNSSLLRTPSAIEGQGGAISETQARDRNRMLQVRDQMAQLAFENGLPVAPAIAASLLPTPTTQDQRDGSYLREITVDGLERGVTRGISLNHLTDGISIEQGGLLPTPNTMDSMPPRTPEQILEAKSRNPGGYSNLRESVINNLPTPTARDHKDGTEPHFRDGVLQTDTLGRALLNSSEILLGTPRASASASSATQVANGAKKGRIEDQVLSFSWGKFEPAIRRWEMLMDRPAPAPTKPDGKNGAHRLSSVFTEWMMGLPAGWITDVGLTRTEELKACGNGVVPQQAMLALEMLNINEILGLDA